MKKIFTLMFAVGMLAVAQAQPPNRDTRQPDQRNNPQTDQRNYPQNDQRGFDKSYNNGKDNVFNNNSYGNDGRYGNKSFSSDRERDMQIARINQEYEFKIQKVMHSFFMGWYEKQRQIHFLQEQRQREISMVYYKSYDRRGRFDDRDNHSRDRW